VEVELLFPRARGGIRVPEAARLEGDHHQLRVGQQPLHAHVVLPLVPRASYIHLLHVVVRPS
jgi:hypothetical protein